MSRYSHLKTGTILVILSSILALTSSQPSNGSFHLSLIHRDSSFSPLYNPRETLYDRVRYSFIRSKARLSYLISRVDGDGGDFQGSIEADDGEYFVRFSIGTPPVQMLASIDTASPMVLTRCLRSLTYNNITCNSSNCALLPDNACDSSNMCSFSYRSNSLIGSDVFTFEPSNGGVIPLENIIFGCEYGSDTTFTRSNGILGLGYHNLSLIMQTSSITEPKFTYCLGKISDPEAKRFLVLGSGFFLEGQTTSLKVIEGKYNLVLEGISIGRKKLMIPPEIFQQRTPLGGGVIIDAETTLTFLAPLAYNQLVGDLEKELGLAMVIWPDPPYDRCYNGKLSDIQKFRGLIFHFEREVNVLLGIDNLFLQVDDGMFCLAVLPSPVGGTSVLGSLFQQSYSVGYHLGQMLVSFQPMQCELIEQHLS
ncbi:hypothetical protein SOVF_156480 [Spinacia oleracea]|uniref:Probable aspartic protease At2g35615 n=1 Tax=Spinacia oleracea TaxID=3562 RepID=A0A9R0KC70_SPIOL|nr:probable aspartic protease At2g35615 [Spinacia oleracea]KNA09112.1 hypothetical protein SOVF_156480 [Spinacia oleracea]